jgi:hypothetical protein
MDKATEVEPIDEMPVRSLMPEPAPAEYEAGGDLMNIPEPEESPSEAEEYYEEAAAREYVDQEDKGYDEPAPQTPVIPEADDENVVEFTSDRQPARAEPPMADFQKVRGERHGKKVRQQPAQPQARKAAEPARKQPPAPPAPPTPPPSAKQPPKQPPIPRPAPEPAQPMMRGPAKPPVKLPRMFIAAGVVIIVLLGVIAYLMGGNLNKKMTQPTAAEAALVAAEPAKAPAAASAPVAEPAPSQAPAVAPAPAPAPSAAPTAQAPAVTPPPPPPPAPEPPKAKAMSEMVMCASPDMALVVTDPQTPNGSGRKPADVAFCIDKHELSAGDKPKGGLSSGSAAAACRKAGKKVCTGKQWLKACGNGTPAASNCAISGAVRKSGSMAKCVTTDGVFDMIGNVGEVTADREVRGGDVGGGGAGCDYSAGKHFQPKGTVGTRCCMDPEYKL